MSSPRSHGTIAVLCGLVLVTGSRLINLAAQFLGKSTLMEVMKDVGVAIFIFGMFNILVDLPSWRKYFEERIKAILIQQDYLDGLSDGVLLALETNVLKARFKSTSLSSPESLHHFIRKNIQTFLPLPYHENTHAEVVYESAGPGLLLVTDKVSYTSRAVDGKLDRMVRWVADGAAYKTVKGIKLEITYPSGHPKAGRTETPVTIPPGKRELLHQLSDDQASDRIRLAITAKYVIDEQKMQYWELSRPARDVEVTLKFPDAYTLSFTSFVPVAQNATLTEAPGYFHLKYLDWTLRNSGFAWQLRR